MLIKCLGIQKPLMSIWVHFKCNKNLFNSIYFIWRVTKYNFIDFKLDVIFIDGIIIYNSFIVEHDYFIPTL